MNVRPMIFALAGACIAGGTGCAHLATGSVAAAPTSSPTASASPSSAPCTLTAAANAQIVVVSPLITPVVDPTFGIISGYGPVTSGNASNVASPINTTASATVQFFNNDVSNSQLRYSAAGIPNVNAFPGSSFTFPAAAVAQIGTQINATATWSTGLLAGQCYSQVFTIAGPGRYFFGDVTYYGLANVRDVIVATR